ncbi:CrcB protein [Desulfonispora thiosulfatigenes DSM 11270]|uniref:Fluoride-specific ion channel FluC n=1 Tax=Desulfonispora thiosulfatigenes DSM 11270 TaxID=656914 RepID=A0A1W1VBF9_DESTI|nr:fluoride efflux transporter CrcB [Desulfonispora thiosulfatigenes]SMB90655.1 CrcB protein [Desulfonispora thiosulfatigenes DSM 11270]
MFTYLYVAIGGSLGAVSRYLLSNWVNNKAQSIFPFGTFSVNMIGSFIIGVFYIVSMERLVSPELKLIISVGFLGAFTTFSTFSLETLNLMRENHILTAFINIGLSIIIGLIAAWLGIIIGKLLVN